MPVVSRVALLTGFNVFFTRVKLPLRIFVSTPSRIALQTTKGSGATAPYKAGSFLVHDLPR